MISFKVIKPKSSTIKKLLFLTRVQDLHKNPIGGWYVIKAYTSKVYETVLPLLSALYCAFSYAFCIFL